MLGELAPLRQWKRNSRNLGPTLLNNHVQEGLFAYWSCACVHQNQKSMDDFEKRRPRSGKSSKKTVMTEEETALIADSWELVRQDLKGHGLKFFKQ